MFDGIVLVLEDIRSVVGTFYNDLETLVIVECEDRHQSNNTTRPTWAVMMVNVEQVFRILGHIA